MPCPSWDPRAQQRSCPTRQNRWTLTESFVDGHPTPTGAHPAATHLSVFAGDDPARWQPDVASYTDVALGDVWPGIAVSLAAYGKQVEKVFTVEPGAVPDTIPGSIDGQRWRVPRQLRQRPSLSELRPIFSHAPAP